MNQFQKRILTAVIDVAAAPFLFPAACLMKLIRQCGVGRLPICRKILNTVGVFPIRKHYYEPQFDLCVDESRASARALPGINWNVNEQLEVLNHLTFAPELESITTQKKDLEYYANNGAFDAGDADYLYQLIRWKKPKNIIEIGSGSSTLIALRAARENLKESPDYTCQQICIEPFEHAWLEKTGLKIVRSKVEDVSLSVFDMLGSDDLLFIDSSHMIRPDGDVLFEYLQILPRLKNGVVVHIHDIFSPRNYPKEWIQDEVRFWNEQYLLEAFLTENSNWKILGALNFLAENYPAEFTRIAPLMKIKREKHMPGSFYIQKVTATNNLQQALQNQRRTVIAQQ